MSHKPVVTVEDITNIALEERRPGCDKGLIHEDAPVQTAVYRVQPGSGVPTHLHARVRDILIGVKASTATAVCAEILKASASTTAPDSVRPPYPV